MNTNIDDEWMKFISNQAGGNYGNAVSSNNYGQSVAKLAISCDDSDDEDLDEMKSSAIAPDGDDLYISTTTKVMFLNQQIDIYKVFWNIPIVEYWRPQAGILKKQIKVVSNTPEEFAEYQAKLQGVPYYNENIIKQINNPSARRLKFKDERKITIGLSKKDIMNCRGKVKNAFYNCFAVILRFKYEGIFKEIHVKIFNTKSIHMKI